MKAKFYGLEELNNVLYIVYIGSFRYTLNVWLNASLYVNMSIYTYILPGKYKNTAFGI